MSSKLSHELASIYPKGLDLIENLLHAQHATPNINAVNDAISSQEHPLDTLFYVAGNSISNDSSSELRCTGPTTLNDVIVVQEQTRRLAEESTSGIFEDCMLVTQHDQEKLRAQI